MKKIGYIKIFSIAENFGAKCGASTKSYIRKYFEIHKGAWKDSYRTSWVLNIVIENFPKAENVSANCEVSTKSNKLNILKTITMLEKVYTKKIEINYILNIQLVFRNIPNDFTRIDHSK